MVAQWRDRAWTGASAMRHACPAGTEIGVNGIGAWPYVLPVEG